MQPKIGPFYFYKDKVIAPEPYQKRINPETYQREVLGIDGHAGEHRDMWDNYMLLAYPELKEEYDDDHKALPRGRVDCENKDGVLRFWVTLDRHISEKEDEITHIFDLVPYEVEFFYGTMNYRCKNCMERA